MNENKKLIPKRRFKEFKNAGAWEQRRLGEIGKTYNGLSGKTKEDFGQGSAKFITYINVFSNSITDLKMVESVKEDNCQNKVKKGDVFFTTSSETKEEVGMSSVLIDNLENTYLNSFCFGYRLSIKLDNYFLANILRNNNVRNQFKILAQGISRYNISKNKAMNISISIPLEEEQKVIGRYFKSIDHLITLHQRKLEKAKSLKSALLSEMFPAEGESKPKRRFKGFTDDWEQRKLRQIATEVNRSNPKSDAPIMMITANSGFIEQSERYTFNNAGDSLKKYILLKNGELAYNHGASKLRPYGSCFALTTVKNARIPFVYHCFNVGKNDSEFISIKLNGSDVEKQLRRIVSSSARMDGLLNISYNEYSNVQIRLPCITEQKKIAKCFQYLDNLITLHQRKLEKLENVKKAYLNEMFV